jgi:hypothetical protein
MTVSDFMVKFKKNLTEMQQNIFPQSSGDHKKQLKYMADLPGCSPAMKPGRIPNGP